MGEADGSSFIVDWPRSNIHIHIWKHINALSHRKARSPPICVDSCVCVCVCYPTLKCHPLPLLALLAFWKYAAPHHLFSSSENNVTFYIAGALKLCASILNVRRSNFCVWIHSSLRGLAWEQAQYGSFLGTLLLSKLWKIYQSAMLLHCITCCFITMMHLSLIHSYELSYCF